MKLIGAISLYAATVLLCFGGGVPSKEVFGSEIPKMILNHDPKGADAGMAPKSVVLEYQNGRLDSLTCRYANEVGFHKIAAELRKSLGVEPKIADDDRIVWRVNDHGTTWTLYRDPSSSDIILAAGFWIKVKKKP